MRHGFSRGDMRQGFLKSKKQVFFKNIREMPRGLFLQMFLLIVFSFPCLVVARDFLSSVENASSQIRQIIAVVGVLALMIAGVCFYWSKKLGMEKLSAAIIGTVVFAAASTIFTLFYQAFN